VKPNNNPDINKRYIEEKYWDISQVKLKKNLNSKPKIKLYQALWLTTEELEQLVDGSKDRKLTSLEKQEFGVYRYAIKVKNMQERQVEINDRMDILKAYQPLTTDKPLIDYKMQQYKELEELLEIRLKPKYKQNNTEKRQLRSEEHTSELQSRFDLVCRLLLEKKKWNPQNATSD